MFRNIQNLSLLAFFWGLAIILPHFQPRLGILVLLLDSIVVGFLFLYLYRLLDSDLNKSNTLKILFAVSSIGGFGCGLFLLALGIPQFYDVWSHLGAGTMKFRGQIFIFGDLAHLTSAASCDLPIKIGTNLCDPWSRVFNQNPHLGTVFRLFHLTNLMLVGLVSVGLFLLIIYIASQKLKIESVGVYLLLATPVMVLAIDRGNELITLTLLMPGLYFIRNVSGSAQTLGAFALSLAVFFKFWPIFVIFLLMIYQWGKFKIHVRVILAVPVVYCIARIQDIADIMNVTQSGSPLGASFGLKLFMNPILTHIELIGLVSITILVLSTLVKCGSPYLLEFVFSESGSRVMPWLLPIMLTYSLIWLTSNSFMYRMLILVPMLLMLLEREIFEYRWPKLMVVVVLVGFITSRLPITTGISSALALYFVCVAFKTYVLNCDYSPKLKK